MAVLIFISFQKTFYNKCFVIIIFVALITSAARAQSDLSPVIRSDLEQRRALEREQAQRELLQKTPDAMQPAAPAASLPWPQAETPCFVIHSIVLSGASSADFQWALQDVLQGSDQALGRCLGIDGINVAVQRVQQKLIGKGFVTSRVLLQPQDLSAGLLTLTLVPGRVRQVRLADGVSQRATFTNALPVQSGDILNLRAIEQGLENLKRVPTAEADIQIVPAELPGESDVLVQWTQAFPFRLTTSVDDSGTRATGKYQGSVTVSYDHWLTLNDLFYVSFNHDLGGGDRGERGTRGQTVHYSLPWGYNTFSVTAFESRYYQSVAGFAQDYVYSGTSQNAEFSVARLIYRDAHRKTSLSLKGWLRRSANSIDDTEVLAQRRATGGWGLGVAHKEFLGRATLDLNLTHKRGTAAFGAKPAAEEAFGEGTSRMQVTTADASLDLPFALAGQQWRYQSNWRVQWNGTPLTPQDRFAIGGRYTVRGFDGESSLVAERGWLLRNDLGLALPAMGAQIYLGVDYGQVSGPSARWLQGTRLAGAALGLRGSLGKISYEFFVARPVSKPQHFNTASTTAGFSLFASF